MRLFVNLKVYKGILFEMNEYDYVVSLSNERSNSRTGGGGGVVMVSNAIII